MRTMEGGPSQSDWLAKQPNAVWQTDAASAQATVLQQTEPQHLAIHQNYSEPPIAAPPCDADLAAPPVAKTSVLEPDHLAAPTRAAAAAIRRKPEYRRRVWMKERSRDVPCWLTSMVAHLTLLILIASIILPPSKHQGIQRLSLVLTPEEAVLDAGDLSVVLMDDDPADVDGGQQGEHTETPTEPDNDKPDKDKPAEVEEPPTPDVEQPEDPLGAVAGFEQFLDALDSPADELEQHFPENKEQTVSDAPTPEQIAQASADVAALHREVFGQDAGGQLRNPSHDDIVDRFILYDVGRLSVAEGQRARREFEQLGPESIPALVRGLNKAANIRASCPIVVIASKLNRSLRESENYGALRYALDNLGRDIPLGAPHRSRVMSVRSALEDRLGSLATFLDQDLRSHGLEITDDLLARILRFRKADVNAIEEALRNGSADDRLAAAVAISQRKWPAGQRAFLGNHLTTLMSDDEIAVREQALRGSRALANGRHATRPFPADNIQWKEAAAYWENHWRRYRQTARIERRARADATRARSHERHRDFAKAQRAYQQIVIEYPGTGGADLARQRLAKINDVDARDNGLFSLP